MLPLGHTQQEYSYISFDYGSVTNPGCHESDATGGFVYIREWAPVGPAGWQLACDIARPSDSKPGRKPWFATLWPCGGPGTRHNRTLSITDMLSEIKWRSLEQRRADVALTMLYKIRNGQLLTSPTHLTPVTGILTSIFFIWYTMNFQWKKRFREMALWACAVARVPGKLCQFA